MSSGGWKLPDVLPCNVIFEFRQNLFASYDVDMLQKLRQALSIHNLDRAKTYSGPRRWRLLRESETVPS